MLGRNAAVDEREKAQDTKAEVTQSESHDKKKYDIKGGIAGRARQILLTALVLAVSAVGALITLSAGLSGVEAKSSGLAVFFGVISLLGWIALVALSVKNKDRAESVILCVIFILNIVGFMGMMLWSAGTESEALQEGAAVAASFAPVIICALIALPYFAAYPLFEALGLSPIGCMAIISIAVVGISAWNYFRLLEKKKKDEIDNSKIGYIFSYFDGSEGKDKRNDRW